MYKERLKQCFKHLYEFRGPYIPMAEIDVRFVKEFLAYRLNQNAAVDTVRRERTALARIFDTLIEHKLVSTNPVRLVKWHPDKKSKVDRRPFISLADFHKILRRLPEFYCALAVTAYYTGARQGELRCLTLGQLDLTGRMIRLTSADTKEGAPKRIPLRMEVVHRLSEVMAHRTPMTFTDNVFLKEGLPLERHHLKRDWESARAEEGFPSLRFHDLRHTWKTHCMPMDRGIRMAILGHSGGTHEGYGSLTDAHLLEAIDSIDFTKQDHSYGL